MKKQIRILGIDDAPFSFTEKYTTIIGVVMRGGQYLEGVLSKQIHVDGTDSTQTCQEMIQSTKHRQQLKVAMLDGAAFGGFNVIDCETLYKTTHLPIITITRDKPNFQMIQKSLQKNFHDWESRWKIINNGTLHEIQTKHNPIYIKCTGISLDEAKDIINLSTIRGVIPEPVRIAHIIASGILRGESYGKA